MKSIIIPLEIMGKIMYLDKNLINQISAGEVVERPVSIVKELIENALDAKSTNIKIEIMQGGKKEIIISDDGVGIGEDDLQICLEKYTTSKISSLEDLYNVLSFGFRGEALASISSVSNMSIISKTKDSLIAYKIEYSNETGKIFTKSSHGIGTTVSVKNLFYNTPARLNYLKQDKTEYGKILSYIQNVALSYPEVGFECIHDDKKVCKYQPNETLQTRIYEIYGEEFAKNMKEIYFEMLGIEIQGSISDPKINFANRNRQHLFVNKRPISSPIISKAIGDAYNRFIPHGSQGAYILNITINPTLIDVNVHPRKAEIRFENEQNIFRCVYHAVLNTLEKVTLIETKVYETKRETKEDTVGSPGKNISYFTSSGSNNLKDFSPYKDTSFHPNQSQIKTSLDFTQEILQDVQKKEDFMQNDLHHTRLGKIIGQSFCSYIIVENESKIIILDQHALAERVIYEKLIAQDKSIQIQKLLFAENIKLTSHELTLVEDNKDMFTDIGFEIEILGNGIISIYSIPDFIKKENIKDIFLGVIEDIDKGNTLGSKTIDEVKNKIYASMSCRSAIKFGTRLNLFEMNKLLNDTQELYTSTCPHGRPVIFEIDLDDLKSKYER